MTFSRSHSRIGAGRSIAVPILRARTFEARDRRIQRHALAYNGGWARTEIGGTTSPEPVSDEPRKSHEDRRAVARVGEFPQSPWSGRSRNTNAT
jgi:hypothetical protein